MTHASYDGPQDAAKAPPPRRLRYPCMVADCPMPGTMFLGAGDEGICPWHYGSAGSDRARITETMQRWRPLIEEINRARRVLTSDEHCADVRYQNECFYTAWATIEKLVAPCWHTQIGPQAGDDYGRWAKHLERFLEVVLAGKAKPAEVA